MHEAHAHALTLASGFALPIALFLAGLAGGFAHCVGMCGPFVIAQATARAGRVEAAGFGTLQRLGGAALAPYHLGRATTYAALGAAAGGLAGVVADLPAFRWLLALMLALASGFFLAQAFGRAGAWLERWLPRPPATALAGATRPLAADPRGLRGYGLGVALGFLPCGLLYGALAAAAGAGSAAAGALAMLAFTAGTVPALVAVGWLGAFAAKRFARATVALAPALMLLNAAILLWLALRAL